MAKKKKRTFLKQEYFLEWLKSRHKLTDVLVILKVNLVFVSTLKVRSINKFGRKNFDFNTKTSFFFSLVLRFALVSNIYIFFYNLTDWHK